MSQTTRKFDFDTDRLHDILVEVNGRSYTERQLITIFEALPPSLQNEALFDGFDTVASDSIYTYLKRHGVPTV